MSSSWSGEVTTVAGGIPHLLSSELIQLGLGEVWGVVLLCWWLDKLLAK